MYNKIINYIFKKLFITLIIITVLTVIFSVSNTYSYWADDVIVPDSESVNIGIQIGEWEADYDGPNPTPPQPLPEPEPYDGYDLNEWIDNGDIDHLIPINQVVKYEDHIYIVIGSFNPANNGFPGPGSLQWAVVQTALKWYDGYNYRDNSVVTYEGKYYISYAGAWNVWVPTTTWAWKEIEPISDEHFDYFMDTNLIDYASPDWDYIIYK